MPLVMVSCDYGVITQSYRDALSQILTQSVAKALQLDPSRGLVVMSFNIIVQFRNREPADRNPKDIDVIIFAHDFPERLENEAERAQQVADDVAAWCDDSELNTELGQLRGRVIMQLAPMEFGVFPRES